MTSFVVYLTKLTVKPFLHQSKSKSRGGKKSAASQGPPDKPLDEILPNIFTWVCEPKEASFGLIRKYIAEHHKKLDVEGKMFLK